MKRRDTDHENSLVGMEERTRDFDWSKTPVGPESQWPQGLKTAVRIMLGSRYAMWLGWGPEFIFFYNDAYAEMTLGSKHPWALGRPAQEVWPEIWGDIGPRAESVIRTGEATWDQGLLLFLERRGFPEETYHTFSYSPLPGDGDEVGGMLCVVTEDTERAIGERRLQTLRELAARTTDESKTVSDSYQNAADILAVNPKDIPFCLLYSLESDGRNARLAGYTGVEADSSIKPAVVDIQDPASAWPFSHVAETGEGVKVDDLTDLFGPLKAGIWSEPLRMAVVLPLAKPGQTQPAGFLVAGVSPRRPFDDGYKGFLDLIARQIGTAVANARAYEEERRRADQLAELDRAKTAFFSNVSHEFRTPLTLMLGPVEDMLSRSYTELSPAAKGQLEVVNRNGLRLLRLVNSLLDFSRIEAGRVRAVFQPTDLAGYTAELASVFRSAIERAGLRFTVDCRPVDEPVYIDRDMWEKVVLNLLSNAFKFTFEGEIAVTLRQEAASVCLEVRDTGTGIPAEEMPRLFERFHRIENARGRTHEGSGIGLALVNELVKLHGGSINTESAMGVGSTFAVSVPLGSKHLPADQVGTTRSAASTGEGSAPYVEEALRWLPEETESDFEWPSEAEALPVSAPPDRNEDPDRPLVLVADDNADMRKYVSRLLGEQYRVTAVADGDAALSAIRENLPDLVLSDVMMPVLDGFGLLAALRSDPRTASVPVIMLSARAGEESRVEGMDAGADDYLIKPFSARELLARVGAHLQMARLRQEAAEEIRAGEERLSAALAAARMVAWQWNAKEDTVVVSATAAEVLGLPEGTIEGGDYASKLIHPDDREQHSQAVAEAVRRGESYLSRYRVIRPDNNETVWLEDRGHGVVDNAGETTQIVGLVMDITDRQRGEEALQNERDLLSVTLTSIGDAVITTDTEGTITNLNPVAEELTGWASSEATGKHLDQIFRIVNEDTRATVESPAARALRDGVIVGLANHTVLIKKDGSEIPIDDSAAPIRHGGGDVAGCVLVFRDVTERRRMESALREREAHFRSMADNAPALIWVTDASAVCTFISQRWCEYTGTKREDNLGIGWLECVHPDDISETKRIFLNANATQAPFSLDYRIRRHDGEYRWAVDAGSPRFNADGQFQGYVGTVTDVHERELAAEGLRQAAAELSEANRQKTEFLATLGHELRNPLAPICTGLDLMKMVADDPLRVEEIRSVMTRQTRQMVRLIDDLLDIARITHGKVELRKCQVSLQDVAEGAAESVRSIIDEAGHELILDLPDQTIYLEADPARLAQIVSNLLSNSAKYTPGGGRIWLTATRRDGELSVSVRDNGIGIPAERQAQIFEMFAQIDRSLERGHRGLGVGLTLVKRLVELHGGAIEVKSEGENTGSEFIFTLPVRDGEQAVALQSTNDSRLTPAGAGRVRVLVVDDNKEAAEMLGTMIRLLGNDVSTAHDGLDAVRVAEQFRPAIILMDLGMPLLNGYEAAKRIKAKDWSEGMVLVALTGWGQDEDKQRTKAAGFDFHLVKPAEPSELQDVLAQARRKRA